MEVANFLGAPCSLFVSVSAAAAAAASTSSSATNALVCFRNHPSKSRPLSQADAGHSNHDRQQPAYINISEQKVQEQHEQQHCSAHNPIQSNPIKFNYFLKPLHFHLYF